MNRSKLSPTFVLSRQLRRNQLLSNQFFPPSHIQPLYFCCNQLKDFILIHSQLTSLCTWSVNPWDNSWTSLTLLLYSLVTSFRDPESPIPSSSSVVPVLLPEACHSVVIVLVILIPIILSIMMVFMIVTSILIFPIVILRILKFSMISLIGLNNQIVWINFSY